MDLFILSICNNFGYIPFSEAVMQWKPVLVLLTLICWNMALQDKVGIFKLCFWTNNGLLNGSVFGLHGLLFV